MPSRLEVSTIVILYSHNLIRTENRVSYLQVQAKQMPLPFSYALDPVKSFYVIFLSQELNRQGNFAKIQQPIPGRMYSPDNLQMQI